MNLPDTISSMVQQLGGRGLQSAFAYCGAKQITYKCARADGEYRRSYRSKSTPDGIDFDVGLKMTVNSAKPGLRWEMVVAYEPDDTYTVWLWQWEHGEGELLDHREDVYCDQLQSVLEGMYDRAVQKTWGCP